MSYCYNETIQYYSSYNWENLLKQKQILRPCTLQYDAKMTSKNSKDWSEILKSARQRYQMCVSGISLLFL